MIIKYLLYNTVDDGDGDDEEESEDQLDEFDRLRSVRERQRRQRYLQKMLARSISAQQQVHYAPSIKYCTKL